MDRFVALATAVLAVLLFIPTIASAQTEITIQVRVVDEMSKLGVPGRIFQKKDCANPNCPLIGEFDGKPGYVALPCQKGLEIYAMPTAVGYFELTRKGTYCFGDASARVDMLATPFLSTAYAGMAGAAAFERGKYGEAVVLYSEANALKPDKATEKLVYLSIAKKLGIGEREATFFDPGQNKDVPSRLLVDEIKKFQRLNGLEANGLIGSKTQTAIVDNAKPIDVMLKYSTNRPSIDRGS